MSDADVEAACKVIERWERYILGTYILNPGDWPINDGTLCTMIAEAIAAHTEAAVQEKDAYWKRWVDEYNRTLQSKIVDLNAANVHNASLRAIAESDVANLTARLAACRCLDEGA